MPQPSVTDSFSRYFHLLAADTQDLRNAVFRVRYRVYCREFHYEREEDCPDGMEQDAFDAQSRHCLLVHRATARSAGCVRIVEPRRNDLSAPLPFELHCADALDRSIFDPLKVDRRRLCEISRLAVTSEFRRRPHEAEHPISLPDINDPDEHGRDSFPLIPLGLFLAAASVVLNGRYEYYVAMMEPRLARLLVRFGLIFTRVGKLMDYHGPRAPFLLTQRDLLRNLQPPLHDLLICIDRQLSINAHDS